MHDISQLTFVEVLHTNSHNLHIRMLRYRNLLILVIRRRHPERQSAPIHQRLRRELQDIVQHQQKAVRLPRRDEIRILVHLHALGDHPRTFLRVLDPQHLQPFAHPVGRVAHYRVEYPAAYPVTFWLSSGGGGGRSGSAKGRFAYRRVGQISSEHPAQVLGKAVLLKVPPQGLLLLVTSDAAPVNIGPKRQSAELRAGNREGTGADEGVVDQLSRCRQGNVGRDQGELGVHGGRGDVSPLFEVQLFGQRLPGRSTQVPTKVVVLWIGDAERCRVPRPVFKKDEFLVGVAHLDRAGESEVGEGVDDGQFLVVGARALVGVDGELEGAGQVLGP